MLNFLGGAKVDHPMADVRKAKEIIAELPSDPLKALAEITQWLESLRETKAYKLERLFENIDLLDAAAKNHQRKLSQDYFATSRQQKFQENRLWSSSFNFWKALSDAYLECVARFEGTQTGGTAFRKNLPIIVARTLRALTLQLKWILVRYGPVDSQVWMDIGRLYQFAEASGTAETTVAIYPGSHGGGSVRQEFLKAVMLAASSTDGLSPMRQELAERAVAHFSPGFRLAQKPGPGCGYCFDIAGGKPPFRVMGGRLADSPTARYFGAGEAFAALQRVEGIVVNTGAIPSDVHLGGVYDKDAVIPVLRHLLLYWGDDAPARSAQRRQTVSRMTVLHGMDEILRTLDPGSSDELDFSDPAEAENSAESWIVENVSEGGYGAIIPAAKSDWVRVGALIGVKTEVAKHWGVGVIRRVTRDEHQQRRVGIQALSTVVIPIRVGKSGAGTDPALLLSTTPDKQGEVGVVMRAGIFNSRDSLNMTVNNKPYLLLPSRLAEGGEDFDWAKFKVMQRSD